MAVSSWVIRHQNIRSGRYNRQAKKNKQEDILTSLIKLDPHESFKIVLTKICEKDVEEEVLFSHLTAFIKLILHYENHLELTGYNIEDLLYCLRISLLHDSTQIRTMGLKCIRHLIKTKNDVVQLNKLLISYLLIRSLDLLLRNDAERIEAMKLTRKCLILAPTEFDISVARCLIALAFEGSEAKDRMLRICLATLSELGVLNSELFIMAGGVTAISRNLIECQIPKIAESLCGVLLLLLDKPTTRNYAAIDLHCAAAPFCDFHYKHGLKDKHKRDERELKLNCGRLALLTILRSWSGVLHFCSPNDRGGFRAIVEVLYLKQLEVRKSVLDLLYELLGLSQPEWTDELSVALGAVDPCEPQASWRLNEGFVVAEGKSVLPHLAKTTPSMTDMHMALLLYCFLENGLLAALTEVIATSDTFICVRASVLLGELLRLIQFLLPPGCCNISPSLPTLLEYATKSKPQAITAVTALEQLHMLMKNRPASYSLHLDYIIRNSYHKRIEHKYEKKHKNVSGLKTKLHQVTNSIENLVLREGEDMIKETGVLSSNDAYTWDWNLIGMLMKRAYRNRINLNDSSHRTFMKKLIEFYMPSKNKYSHMDLGLSRSSNIYTTVGIDLLNFLVDLKECDYNGFKPLNILLDFYKDVQNNINAITTSKSVHDCLFSPQHMGNTQCQSYFLFIGQFARTDLGMKVLEDINMFTKLKELATTTNHDCYVKLIISSLEYIFPGPCREILEAVLICNSETSRLYATQFLHILLRAGNPLFSSWAIQLLVNQLYDKSRSVYLSALATLHEACELRDCLEALIDINPNLEKLGERGTVLFVRLLSVDSGYKKIIHDSKTGVVDEIKKWDDYFVFRYVKLVEGDISDALTLHQRNEDGKYDKRASYLRNTNKRDVFILPHLYGQLNQHSEGYDALINHGQIEKYINIIKKSICNTDEEIMNLKAAIWATCHFGSSNRGYEYLMLFEVIDYMIILVTRAPVYSIRATAFYALSLLATLPLGADDLAKKGWLCTRHDRHDYWPIIKEDYQKTLHFNQMSVSTSADITSLNNTFGFMFEHADDDETESEERQDFQQLLVHSPILENKPVRQLTLPANKRPPIVIHKRSLSESKTFDINNGYEEETRTSFIPLVYGRHRNSSMTESTTSGVSSCDSLPNKPGTCANYLKTLSPIPSSSSLSTLQLPPGPFRRVSHRVSSNSTTNSDVSTSSLTGSASNELSIQNLMGYNTLKLLRMESLNYDKHNFEKDYLLNTTPHLTPTNTTLIDDFRILESSFPSSSFSASKIEVESSSMLGDKRYLGICLPKILTDLFPSQEEINKEPRLYPDLLSERSEEDISTKSNIEQVGYRHSKKHCLYCSQVQEGAVDFIQGDSKLEVLKNVERLANPISNKYVRFHLIRFRQREPEPFKDICVYSETCRILSENIYRLPTRRVLHELFLDISYDHLYDHLDKILEREKEEKASSPQDNSISSPVSADVNRKSISSDISSPTESLKTLDALKLTFNENKFPIRNKK